MMRTISKYFLLFYLFTTAISCSRDEYYIDGGIANAYFEGSVIDYLDSKPREFDTIAQIIRLAGLEEEFKNSEFTFFAPRDENIKRLIGNVNIGGSLNRELFLLGRDTVQTLADVEGEIWRKYLTRYMFNGKKLLKDYPQIDFGLLNVFGGQNYISQGNTVCNIGVVYNDAVSNGGGALKYLGYRQLHISYIRDITTPNIWTTLKVASSDVQPRNGVVHVLDYTSGSFGYNQNEIFTDIVDSKR